MNPNIWKKFQCSCKTLLYEIYTFVTLNTHYYYSQTRTWVYYNMLWWLWLCQSRSAWLWDVALGYQWLVYYIVWKLQAFFATCKCIASLEYMNFVESILCKNISIYHLQLVRRNILVGHPKIWSVTESCIDSCIGNWLLCQNQISRAEY